jgi:peptide deformylase
VESEILTILKYGDDLLKLRAHEVTNLDGRIAELVRLMGATMYAAPGVGLAAPQIGQSLRLFTMDPAIGETPSEFMVWINPEIAESAGSELRDEGCLSVPGYNLPIRRKTRLLLKGFDLNGRELQMEFEGFKARVVQHEMDHLDGTLIVDRVSNLKRTLVRQEINKLRKIGEW